MWREGGPTEDLRTRGRTGGEFSGFPFYLIHPKLDTREASNVETEISTDKNSPNKSLISVLKYQEKGSLAAQRLV